MRVRIVRRTAWNTDGIQLQRFNVGDTYDLPQSVGIYLILSGIATAVDAVGAVDAVSMVEVENDALRDEIRQSRVAGKGRDKKR